MQLACDGDASAIETLYRETLPYLHSVCVRRGGSQHDAEEAIAEAWVRVLRRMRKGDFEVSNFAAYVGRAVQTCLYDSWQRKQRVVPSDLAFYDPRDPHDSHAETLDRLVPGRVHIALAQLAPDRRELLHAAVVEGRSYTDIAREAGITPNAMANRAAQARRKFTEAYQATAHTSSR